MKTYHIYIKSHCEAPDYEDTCEADSYEEASRIFIKRMNNKCEDVWSSNDLLEYIEEDNE